MKRLNKKGFGESLLIILAIFLISIFLITFIVKYSVSPAKKEKLLKENLANVEDKILLINYLKTPYKDGIMADYITKGSLDEIKETTMIIINSNQYTSWRLKTTRGNQLQEISKNFNERKEYKTVKAIIPSIESNKEVIEVELNLQ